jgi:small-conductance mechanosensitive channel
MALVKIVIWGLGIIFILDNLGFKISTVIAGLGLGGVAVALAAQTILRDLFNYFVILFDRPFAVGDFIIIGDHMGLKKKELSFSFFVNSVCHAPGFVGFL